MSVAEHSIAGADARGHGFLASSVGRKIVMALTGVVLFGFVTVHMIGNTQAYMGAETFNGYAKFLHSMMHGGGIWIFRAVLLAAAGLHAWSATTPPAPWATAPSTRTPPPGPPAPCAGAASSSWSSSCTTCST